MKPFWKNLTKTTAILVLVTVIASCSEKQTVSEPATSQEEVSETQTEVTAPGIDIHTAAYLGDLYAIKQHISAGSNLNRKDQYGSTPLIIAITFGKNDVARALIDAGADLNVTNNDGSTPLHIAAFFGKPEIVGMLLQGGADKSLRNNYGNTALEIVQGPFELVKPVYDQVSGSLEPLGLKLDYTYLEEIRPRIADLLKAS